MNDPRGSLWRKWDLHFHTPSSYDYRNKGITDEQIIDLLIKNEIALVAITDHHFIDVKRINHLRELAKGKVTILAGIELRTELGGKESVHMIGIFPENTNVESLWLRLAVPLKITIEDVSKIGEEEIYVQFKEAARIIHDLGGIVTVHAGGKSNSIENIKNSTKSKMKLKTDLLNDFVDILEVNNTQEINDYQLKVFPSVNKNLPIIICSDNHNIIEYGLNENCWIRGDTTFQGLWQIMFETDRVYIGETPIKQSDVRRKATKYIRAIDIHKKSTSTCNEQWFHNRIEMNPGLIAIIGNKGGGKSALVDIIGLLGNTHVAPVNFSFLTRDRFCKPNEKKAQDFEAVIEWESGYSQRILLNSVVDENSVEMVRYLPQNYFEAICNEMAESEEGDFDNELKKVIFSHVSSSERMGFETLSELINHITKTTEDTLFDLRRNISTINQRISSLEEQLSPDYYESLDNELVAKQRELEAIEGQKPHEVIQPQENDEGTSQKNAEIISLSNQLTTVQEEIDIIENEISRRIRIRASLQIVKEIIEHLQEESDQKIRECVDLLDGFSLNISDVISIDINFEPLNNAILDNENTIDELERKLDPFNLQSLRCQEMDIQDRLEKARNELDIASQEYQDYLKLMGEWNDLRLNIIGDSETPHTITYLKNKISELSTIPQMIEAEKGNRRNITNKILVSIQKLRDTFKKYYQPVQLYIETHPLAKAKSGLNFDVSIIQCGFKETFFQTYISHNATGSFCGVTEGNRLLDEIVEQYDFNDVHKALEFPDLILHYLSFDMRDEDNHVALSIENQLRKNISSSDLYDFLFSFSYLKPKYILKMGDKELRQLSPGERGALLLVYYLLVDLDDMPLIIDQPEQNLDNQSVYNLLVDCIKEAKQKRQVIIVTHNPNLAVVCDAEQIIVASIDKKNGNRVDYFSGSIENPEINRNILNILEGTRPAFDKRRLKYI